MGCPSLSQGERLLDTFCSLESQNVFSGSQLELHDLSRTLDLEVTEMRDGRDFQVWNVSLAHRPRLMVRDS